MMARPATGNGEQGGFPLKASKTTAWIAKIRRFISFPFVMKPRNNAITATAFVLNEEWRCCWAATQNWPPLRKPWPCDGGHHQGILAGTPAYVCLYVQFDRLVRCHDRRKPQCLWKATDIGSVHDEGHLLVLICYSFIAFSPSDSCSVSFLDKMSSLQCTFEREATNWFCW